VIYLLDYLYLICFCTPVLLIYSLARFAIIIIIIIIIII